MATETEDPQVTPDVTHVEQDPRRPAVVQASHVGTLPDGAPTIEENKLSPQEAETALEWFLSDVDLPLSKVLTVKLGDREYEWTIRAIDGDTIKRSRKMAEEGGSVAAKRARQTGVAPEVDTLQANARIVVAGTVNPDLREAAAVKMRNDGLTHNSPDVDFPAVRLVLHRMRAKPGIIDQIAVAILNLSGYDDEDVQEHAAGKV